MRARLWEGAARHLAGIEDSGIGVAPHSLRAVGPQGLRLAAGLSPAMPVHLHAAEQEAEVAEVLAATGRRPVEWLLGNVGLSPRWCLIHATQMRPHETLGLARSGAVAGLCPITESNLGDGIFDAGRFLAAGGRFGVGTDSNIRISLAEELRVFEYSQRLAHKGRAMLAQPGLSTGRVLWQGAVAGGAQAGGRASGAIAPGLWADLVALDCSAPDMVTTWGDARLDSFVFAGGTDRVQALWSAGRRIVRDGRHVARDGVVAAYARVAARLRGAL